MSYELFAKLHERLLQGESAASLEDTIPDFTAKLAAARRVSARHWADSTPYDELAKQYILSRKVLDAIGIEHKVTHGVVHVPAGLMHSYGYLFSQLQTAFGLKGKRWIESRLDERLGLPAGTFSPFAERGEFLDNLTRALHYAIRPKTRDHRYHGYVLEELTWIAEGRKRVQAKIYTHLVDLDELSDLKTSDVKLLVHEIAYGQQRPLLVTAFPVDRAFVASIEATPVEITNAFKPRFNLYIDPSWQVVERRSYGFRPAK